MRALWDFDLPVRSTFFNVLFALWWRLEHSWGDTVCKLMSLKRAALKHTVQCSRSIEIVAFSLPNVISLFITLASERCSELFICSIAMEYKSTPRHSYMLAVYVYRYAMQCRCALLIVLFSRHVKICNSGLFPKHWPLLKSFNTRWVSEHVRGNLSGSFCILLYKKGTYVCASSDGDFAYHRESFNCSS